MRLELLFPIGTRDNLSVEPLVNSPFISQHRKMFDKFISKMFVISRMGNKDFNRHNGHYAFL